MVHSANAVKKIAPAAYSTLQELQRAGGQAGVKGSQADSPVDRQEEGGKGRGGEGTGRDGRGWRKGR